MKFSVSLPEFQKLLQKVLPAIPPKSTLPVLEHLHFSVREDTLRVIATDQDITIMSSLQVNVEEAGTILVPGRRMNEITKALGHEGNITFLSDDITYEISLTTPTGKFSMKGLNPDEYLHMPALFESKPGFNPEEPGDPDDDKNQLAFFSKNDLIKNAENTVFAVSTDEFRMSMTGVLFQMRGTYVNMVATDSYRLAKTMIKSEKNSYPKDLDVVIPARSVELLKKVDEDVVMSFIRTLDKITHARFDFGNSIFITRIIDEKFPPYENVIPQYSEYQVIVDKREFLAAINRVAVLTSIISKQIRITFDSNLLYLTGKDEEGGTAGNDSIPCDFNGTAIELGFNFKYLEEALQHIETDADSNNQVVLTFAEPNRPIIIKPKNDKDNILMLIMPVRINSTVPPTPSGTN